jgi:hypothetical protein
LALSEILGETHRMAGALTAARTAEDAENLAILENRYSRGSRLLKNRLKHNTRE